jgi:hypothetical protein
MLDPVTKAGLLLDEWYICRNARPRQHVLDIQVDKDEVSKWADHLYKTMMWSSDPNEIAECCYQFESRFNAFKDKILIELLTNGSA